MKRLNLILLLIFSIRAAMSQIPTPPQPPPPPPPPPMIQPGQVSKADSLRNDGDLSGAIAEYKKMYLAGVKEKKLYNQIINETINSFGDYLYYSIASRGNGSGSVG
jgi:hypothetical protein